MDLIVPVYLNQKLVFDLVAMSQGGIATVTKVSESKATNEHQEQKMSASFGLNDAFATLLKIGLSGQKANSDSTGSSHSLSEERVHTPSSLFFSLRNLLRQEGQIKDVSEQLPSPGEFIEFEASLRRSPLIEGLDAITKILEISVIFESASQNATQTQKGKKVVPNQAKQLVSQLSSLSSSLKEGGSRDLIADKIDWGYKAVLTVEEQFLNDPTMSDIVDGTFRVVGKVVRVVEKDKGSISLLRKSPLEHTPEILGKFLEAFENLDKSVFSMPAMQTEVRGPVIQVLPIAIFS